MKPPNEMNEKAKEAANLAKEAANLVKSTAAEMAENLEQKASEKAFALEELAAKEAAGLVTAKSLAEGQASIAEVIKSSRDREMILMCIFLAFTIVYGVWIFNNSSTIEKARDAAEIAHIAAARAEEALAQLKADEIKKNRTDCVSFNEQQKIRRDGNITLLVKGFMPFVAQDPDGQKKLDDYAAGLIPIAEITFPYRDCSDAGIAEHLKNPPIDPAQGN